MCVVVKEEKKTKHILELYPGRRLSSISSTTISFCMSGGMNFDTRDQLEDFLKLWSKHFFKLETLTVKKVEE